MPFENLEEFKKLVIIALFSDADLMHTLVLKGGNLLDVVYGISSRPSIDIDLSMRGEFVEVEKARASIEKCCSNCFSERGYIVFDVALREEPKGLTEDMKDFWGGYKVDFKVIGKEVVEGLHGDEEAIRRRAVAVRSDGGRKFPVVGPLHVARPQTSEAPKMPITLIFLPSFQPLPPRFHFRAISQNGASRLTKREKSAHTPHIGEASA